MPSHLEYPNIAKEEALYFIYVMDNTSSRLSIAVLRLNGSLHGIFLIYQIYV